MSGSILTEEYRSKAYVIVGLFLVFWGVEVINLLVGNSLNAYGIVPREFGGLIGVLFAPGIGAAWLFNPTEG